MMMMIARIMIVMMGRRKDSPAHCLICLPSLPIGQQLKPRAGQHQSYQQSPADGTSHHHTGLREHQQATPQNVPAPNPAQKLVT